MSRHGAGRGARQSVPHDGVQADCRLSRHLHALRRLRARLCRLERQRACSTTRSVSTIEAEITGPGRAVAHRRHPAPRQHHRAALARARRLALSRRPPMPASASPAMSTRCRRASLDRPGAARDRICPHASDAIETRRYRAIVRVFMLPGGFRLLVGRDVEERERLRVVIRRAAGWSLLLVFVLGCFGGWFVARRVLKRVDDMTETRARSWPATSRAGSSVAGTGDELDRLALNLNAMLDRIGELMAGMQEVSDNIAHDLKTPLTRLRNRAEEALRTAKTPDELRAALDATIDEADNLIRVFNALLMIARLEAGTPARQHGRLRRRRDRLRRRRALRAAGRGGGRAARRSTVDARPARARQSRADRPGARQPDRQRPEIRPARRRPASRPRVRVDGRARAAAEIELSVADHGPGIPEADRGRVLERFVRLEQRRGTPGLRPRPQPRGRRRAPAWRRSSGSRTMRRACVSSWCCRHWPPSLWRQWQRPNERIFRSLDSVGPNPAGLQSGVTGREMA